MQVSLFSFRQQLSGRLAGPLLLFHLFKKVKALPVCYVQNIKFTTQKSIFLLFFCEKDLFKHHKMHIVSDFAFLWLRTGIRTCESNVSLLNQTNQLHPLCFQILLLLTQCRKTPRVKWLTSLLTTEEEKKSPAHDLAFMHIFSSLSLCHWPLLHNNIKKHVQPDEAWENIASTRAVLCSFSIFHVSQEGWEMTIHFPETTTAKPTTDTSHYYIS